MSQVVTLENFRPPDRFDDVPWTQARIEEAAAESGPFTPIDTQTLSPVDTDPSAPRLRSFTTTEGTAAEMWYRVVFLDATAGVSLPTDPIQNTLGDTSALAEASDLAARLGVTFTDEERDRAETLLTLASGLIRDATRQTITRVTDDEVTRRAPYDDRILLPQRPVVDVTAVTLDGDTVDTDAWYVDGDSLVRSRWAASETSFGSVSGWGGPLHELAITYTHGYDTVPDLVKATVLEMVTRVWVNPGSASEETQGSSTVTYMRGNGLMLTDTEREAINDLLRMQSGTVKLR